MLQEVTLIGRVGTEPESRFTPDGTAVTSFRLVTTETISKQNGSGERPCPSGWKESYNGKNWEVSTWLRITCWRGLAETVNKFVHKGKLLYIRGTLVGEANKGDINGPKVWEDKDGQHRASFEIKADMVKFLDKNGNEEKKEENPF